MNQLIFGEYRALLSAIYPRPRPPVVIVERTEQAQLCEQIQFIVTLLSTMFRGPVLGHCRERMSLAKSPLGRGECSGVLTFQQVISGAVSPQYTTSACVLGGGQPPPPGELRGSSTALAAVAEDVTTSGADATAGSSDDDDDDDTRPQMGQQLQLHLQALTMSSTAAHFSQQRERGVGESSSAASAAGVSSSNPPQQLHHGSSATIAAAAHFSIRMAERQRLRTSSMPAESRKVSALEGIA